MALSNSMAQGLTTASGGITGYSHQADPPCFEVSSSTSLHCTHTFLLLFLFHLSNTYLFILVVPGACGSLGSSQECYTLPMNYDTRQGLSQAWTAPFQAALVQAGCSLRLAPCLGPTAPVWWWTRACSSPGPARVAPCEGCLMPTPEPMVPGGGVLVSGLFPVLGNHPGLPRTELIISGSLFSSDW